MDAFQTVFERTNGLEGKFSDDPNDAGGATKFGITERLARARGYTGPMVDLPLPEAMRIAKLEFWDSMLLDSVVLISYAVAQEMYDTRFNTGQCFLQRCLNKFNREEKLYPDVVEDGNIGPQTIAALTVYVVKRGAKAESVMMKALNAMQGAYYMSITDRREVNEEFIFGWFDNRVEI